MATNSNKYTKQPPISGASTAAVMAERCYIAPADTAYSAPGAKLAGADPGGLWVDLGIVKESRVNLSYTKETKYIETGIEKVRRGAYVLGKTAECNFMLEQYDLDSVALLTGLSITAVGGIGGVLHIGQDDVVEKALLFIGTNKIDGKEHHIYCKKGVVVFQIQQEDDRRLLAVTSSLYPFVASGETDEGFYDWYVLD
jgi:hypothetical protein